MDVNIQLHNTPGHHNTSHEPEGRNHTKGFIEPQRNGEKTKENKRKFKSTRTRTGGQDDDDQGRHDNDSINSSTPLMLVSYWSAPMEAENETTHNNHEKFDRISRTNRTVASPTTATTTTKTTRPLINELNGAAYRMLQHLDKHHDPYTKTTRNLIAFDEQTENVASPTTVTTTTTTSRPLMNDLKVAAYRCSISNNNTTLIMRHTMQQPKGYSI